MIVTTRNSNRSDKGFTLLEVLIAGFILFMVVSTATSIFYSSMRSKNTADAYTLNTAYAPLIAEHIGVLIRDNQKGGNGYWLGVDYSWNAREISNKPVLAYEVVANDPESRVTREGMAQLWQVTLSMSSKGKTQQYEFKITSWK